MSNSESEQTSSRFKTRTTTLDGSSVTSVNQSSEKDTPKLKTTNGEEYEIWRKNIQRWCRLTKMPKTRQAPHNIMKCLHHKELQQITQEVSIEDAETEQGLQLVFQKLDKHFLPNTLIRKLETRRNFRDMRKTDDKTWSAFVKGMTKFRVDMESQKMRTNDEMYCFALLEAANLNTSIRLNVEGISRNVDPNREINLVGLEDALLKL